MFFRWIELCEARPQNARLPILAAGSYLPLLHAVFDGPNLGAIIVWRIADEHHFEERLIRRQVDLVMELRGEGAQFLKNSHANRFKVRLRFAGIVLIFWVPRADALEVAVQPHGIGIRGKAPLG